MFEIASPFYVGVLFSGVGLSCHGGAWEGSGVSLPVLHDGTHRNFL